MEVNLLNSGSCKQINGFALKGQGYKPVNFPALFSEIKHQNGVMLFDTGYSNNFFTATQNLPYSLYRLITPVSLDLSAKEQVGDVDYIFLSHFHADHMAGLNDFPETRIISSSKGYEDVKHKKGFSALKRAYLPDLMSKDFEDRNISIEKHKSINLEDMVYPFKNGFDLFEDEKVIAINLEGHATGQYGLLLDNKIFLVADGCWSNKSLDLDIPQSRVASIITENTEKYEYNRKRLVELRNRRQDLIIIPSHCEYSWGKYGKSKNII